MMARGGSRGRGSGVLLLGMLAGCGGEDAPRTADVPFMDLADTVSGVERLRGSVSTSGRWGGRFGVPVASGFDCDGDGFMDHAMAAMRAAPLARTDGGQVFLVLGDGRIEGTLDSGAPSPSVLSILGATTLERKRPRCWTIVRSLRPGQSATCTSSMERSTRAFHWTASTRSRSRGWFRGSPKPNDGTGD